MQRNLRILSRTLLQRSSILMEPKRTTIIVKRKYPIRLGSLEVGPKRLKRRNFYYEFVENTNNKKKPPLDLVLIKDVPGVGMAGEKISTHMWVGYQNLILPKLAVYATSLEAKNFVREDKNIAFSSIYCKMVENYIASQALPIFLSFDTVWTLEPWHVKMALRKIGIVAKDECIELPLEKISGPDPKIENKDFIVNIIMNKKESYPIRCRIFHWDKSATSGKNINVSVMNSKSEPLFPEDEPRISFLMEKQMKIMKSLPDPQETQKKKKFKKEIRIIRID